MMTVEITCKECGSGINVYPSVDAHKVECDVCDKIHEVKFSKDQENGIIKDCPICERKDFYTQKDFNRKIGVTLFVIAAILSIWTYGISLIVLYLFDLILFKRIGIVAVCYKCQTNFRGMINADDIEGFNHEMNDRIIYADHDFKGKPLSH